MGEKLDKHRTPYDKKVEADFRKEVVFRGFGFCLGVVGVELPRHCCPNGFECSQEDYALSVDVA